MNFQRKLDQLRSLPERTRKIIFWLILAGGGVILFPLWLWYSAAVLNNFNSKEALDSTVKKIEMDGEDGELIKQLQSGVPNATSSGQSDGSEGLSGTTSGN